MHERQPVQSVSKEAEMVIGSTLLMALVAGGLGALTFEIVGRLGGPSWLARWLAYTIALFIFATGPIYIG
jgi:hypothetical protein